MAFLSTTTRPNTRFGQNIAQYRARFADWRLRRAAYVKTRSELSMMSDRDLADIGITRGEIHRVAADAAARV